MLGFLFWGFRSRLALIWILNLFDGILAYWFGFIDAWGCYLGMCRLAYLLDSLASWFFGELWIDSQIVLGFGVWVISLGCVRY